MHLCGTTSSARRGQARRLELPNALPGSNAFCVNQAARQLPLLTASHQHGFGSMEHTCLTAVSKFAVKALETVHVQRLLNAVLGLLAVGCTVSVAQTPGAEGESYSSNMGQFPTS
jgi:hypothetical protein